MDSFLKQVDKQIESNQGKNIFLDGTDRTLKFIDETIKAILNINDLNVDYEPILINYTTVKAIEEFCRINQYYTFDSRAKNDLRDIYRNLLLTIKANRDSIEIIEKKHYSNLRRWLQKTNPHAAQIYSNSSTDIKPICCSEYSADLQIRILKIDPDRLQEPVLDIGCGKDGNLVQHLCKLGIDTIGIDRFSFSDNNLFNADWLEYNYGIEKWGTIISNLGFSNHFSHHHLRKDGNYIEYAKKYMEILKSLKPGGKFHYAPDLPFIETYLDNRQFHVEKYEIGDFEFKTTVIKRL